MVTASKGAIMTVIPKLVTEEQVAEALLVSRNTLRIWRHRGTGPRFVKYGRRVCYLTDEIQAFIEESAVTGKRRKPK